MAGCTQTFGNINACKLAKNDSQNIIQRRNARAETAPVLVDEEEEEAPVVSEQHEVAYHPHHGAQVPEDAVND